MVVRPSPSAEVDEAPIPAALEGRLAKFKQPKRVVFVDDLPRNTMGKVQKNVLRGRSLTCMGIKARPHRRKCRETSQQVLRMVSTAWNEQRMSQR